MRFLFTLVFSLSLVLVSAQKVDKYIFLGKEAVEAKELYKAADFFAQGALITSTNTELDFNYAECLRNLNNYELAEKYYQLTAKYDSTNQYPIAIYWIAAMQKNNGRYKESLSNWELLKRLNAGDQNSEIYKKADQEVRSCAAILKGEVPEYSYRIWNMESLNTINAEFAGSYYDSTSMVYSQLETYNTDRKKTPAIQLESAIKENADWREGTTLPAAINQTGFQNANGSFSTDKRFFLFTRCDLELSCQIYISVYKNGVYSEAFPLKVNVAGATSTQPHMAKTDNGYVLFFSSNRAGGKGGLDIWYAIADDKMNLGEAKLVPGVNSAEDEITPFYFHPTHELFFSSTWFTNLGGWDVFKSKSEDLQSFSAPENVGRPYNSPANDSYFTINNRGYKGLLTSNREGSISGFGKTCCNDIYEFDYPIHLIENLPENGIKNQQIVEPTAKIKELYTQLSSLLPLTLYFHNDEPDPKSTKNFTLLNYQDCYYNYYSVKGRYDEVDPAQSQKIYTELVQRGYDKLERYLEITAELMKLGAAIELDIKGYASPLAKTKYNINLTSRRIESFMNYMKVYREGVLLPYVVAQGNQPQVRVRKLPFGENKSATGVSDDYYKQDLSVYSFAAAKERRIEIVATRLINPGSEPTTAPAVDPTYNAPDIMAQNVEQNNEVAEVQNKPSKTITPDNIPVKTEVDKAAIDKVEIVEPVKEQPKKTEPVKTTTEAFGDGAVPATKPAIKTPDKVVKPGHPGNNPPALTDNITNSERMDPIIMEPIADQVFLTNLIDVDLGKIKRGQLLVKKIKFRNSYGRNISFAKAISDCSCTELKFNTKLLVPDEETVFTILFETRGKIGIQEGTATILTKEIDGNIKIRFKAEVTP